MSTTFVLRQISVLHSVTNAEHGTLHSMFCHSHFVDSLLSERSCFGNDGQDARLKSLVTRS